jgi:hypothetical protein
MRLGTPLGRELPTCWSSGGPAEPSAQRPPPKAEAQAGLVHASFYQPDDFFTPPAFKSRAWRQLFASDAPARATSSRGMGLPLALSATVSKTR